MFTWFTGQNDTATTNKSQPSGFHPIAIPTINATPTNPYVAQTVAAANSSPTPPTIPLAQLAANGTVLKTVASLPRGSEAMNSEDAPPTTTSSSFLFSGMELGKGRRRRQPVSSSSTRSAALQVDESQSNMSHVGVQNTQRERSVPPTLSSSSTELRQRLENFYRLYNPAKLAHVDEIIDTYDGKETQLFEELVRRYGPEPITLSTSQLHTHASTNSPRTEVALSESEVSAFRFITATAEAEAAAPKMVETPSAGTDRREMSLKRTTTHHAPPSAGCLSSSSPNHNGATEVAPTSQRSAAAATSSVPLTVLDAVKTPRRDERRAMEPSAAPVAQTSSWEEEGEEGEEEETLHDRQRRELRESQGTLLEARAALAALLRKGQDALRQRQERVAHIHALESKIQQYVQTEKYREADVLSDDVAHTARAVQQCDEMWSTLGRRIAAAQRQLEEAVRGLASLLRTHEVELQGEEEKDQARVRAQIHHDDADLQLREEKVAVRKEDLTVKKSAAETRLRAARAGEADAQKQVDAKLRTTRAQHENLTKEVAQLDSEIEALKAQLQQLEGKRAAACAQLARETEKLQTAQAAHASELNSAAAIVESCEREMQRVYQQWSDVQTEEARITAERAAREAATAELLKELKDRQDEREAVHKRTCALEQDTIPASDRYWRSWQDLLTKRLNGAGVLFEIPAATPPDEHTGGAPSTFTKKADLLKQLDELTGELHAEEELQRDAQRRLELCAARVAPLTAAKAAAVASKNFKVAQQCADELKVLQLNLEGCQDDVELYGGQVRALVRTTERLRTELAAVETEMRRCAADFKRDYGAAIEAFHETVAHPPDYVQLPKESQCADDLQEAVHGLWDLLRQEWQRACEASADATESKHMEEMKGSGETTAATPSFSPSPSPTGDTAEVGDVASANDGVIHDAAPPSEEDVRRRLEALQTHLEEAIAREAYAECATIQQQIEQLEMQLAAEVAQS